VAEKALVVGAGIMGTGIAQVFAQAGIPVCLADTDPAIVQKSVARIESGLADRVAKGKLDEERKQAVCGLITPAAGLDAAGEADFIVEAIIEDVEVKRETFRELDRLAPKGALLATNTTACSITRIAAATQRPEAVIGMHFFNPAQVMKLVEIMPGLRTSRETLAAAKALVLRIGKEPVVARTEGPAGLASRILAGLLNEAVWVLNDGVGRVADIDAAMKLGANQPMGPFQLIDLIGIDVHLAKTKTLHQTLGDSRYRPCPLLQRMVDAGYLGRKTGRGFYDYSQNPPVPVELVIG
jgi:3-hydroxybutyryl-CoA dehydrogenase